MFVLLRLTLVVATAYLVLAQNNFARPPLVLTTLIAVGLLSNLGFPLLPAGLAGSPRFLAAVIVGDTLWITASLIATGRFHPDFFYLYFFVLFIATIGENLALIVLGALVIGVAYFLALTATGRGADLLTPGTLIRLPFLLAVASFYGYLVDRVRKEENRARAEALVISKLRDSQRMLAETNARLAAEIEERKRIEQELKRISETKSAFVSTVSHELRTPLTAIRNAVDLLADTPAGDSSRARLLAIARRNVDRLAFIVNDLLDISRIEAGRMSFEFQRVELGALLAALVETYQAQALEKGLSIAVRVPGDLPPVWADPGRIEQVLTNLLGNALKFTPAGGSIELAARRRDERVEVSVADTGPGLAAEELARIFEPFYQAGDPLTGRARGTGLGLAIARDLVHAHGSELFVASEEGRGCRFWFEVPVDGQVGREIVALEERIREYRKYPFFSLLVATVTRPPGGPAGASSVSRVLDPLAEAFRSRLPRSSDIIIPQPAHGRLVIVLLGTEASGAEVVRGKLVSWLRERRSGAGDGGPHPGLSGVAAYPADGLTGFALIETALERGRSEGQ